ncbi:hypothetical protein [Roseibium sp. M-1]
MAGLFKRQVEGSALFFSESLLLCYCAGRLISLSLDRMPLIHF